MPLYPTTPPAQLASHALDDATTDILDRLQVVADKMARAEEILLSRTAAEINAILQTQGAAMEGKLTLYAALGQAINTAFETAGRSAPLDVRAFADKLDSRGMQLTAQGVIEAPQPPTEDDA